MSWDESGDEELPRGLLGLPGRLPFHVSRTSPSEDLAWLIDRFWSSAWDVPTGRVVTARVLPHPNVNLTVEGDPGLDEVMLTGIAGGVFHRRLTGRGDVLGVKFSVGAFRLLSTTRVQQLAADGAPGAHLLRGGDRLQQDIRGLGRPDQVRVIEDYLRALELRPGQELVAVQRAVVALLGDPTISRVWQAAELIGVSERTLQRLCATWVGVSPGWLLRRGRLHAAAERVIHLAAGNTSAGNGPDTDAGSPTLADLAADFGYADQAHFTNDFRRVLGEPPTTWAANLVSDSPA